MKTTDFLRSMDPELTDDDIKVFKHLKAIDNIFKRGNLTISELFCYAGTMEILKRYDGYEYTIADFPHITCDGGDPDNYGESGVHPYSEWIALMDERNYD